MRSSVGQAVPPLDVDHHIHKDWNLCGLQLWFSFVDDEPQSRRQLLCHFYCRPCLLVRLAHHEPVFKDFYYISSLSLIWWKPWVMLTVRSWGIRNNGTCVLDGWVYEGMHPWNPVMPLMMLNVSYRNVWVECIWWGPFLGFWKRWTWTR